MDSVESILLKMFYDNFPGALLSLARFFPIGDLVAKLIR